MKVYAVVFSLAFMLFMQSCSNARQPYDLIKPGMTKTEIAGLIGTTEIKKYITKTNNQIQGPEEQFWYDLEMGTKLEVWTYRFDKGTLNLYFTGRSNYLAYKVFRPK